MSKTLILLFLSLFACPRPVEDVDQQQRYQLVEAFPAQDVFRQPLYLSSHPADLDVYYVVTQPGAVYRIPREGDLEDRFTFLDLRERLLTENWEEGLLGFAFDPAFEDNGQFFVYYSEKTGEKTAFGGRPQIQRQSVIARFSTVEEEDGPVADPASELRILTIEEPFGNHNGGTIEFGPDGMLYVAVGDGGHANDPFNNGQNLGTPLGAILRIDVKGATPEQPYRIPDDNPFVGREGARGEIWAYGLRNPWRISFDRQTGELWCGDVGQGLYEEVDRIVKGGNYGWNLREGLHPFWEQQAVEVPAGELLDPVCEYGRSDGISITGGYVYRGTELPDLVGQYVFGDFGTRRQWAVREDRETGESVVTRLCDAPAAIASYAEDENGELLVLCYNGDSGAAGRIYRLGRK